LDGSGRAKFNLKHAILLVAIRPGQRSTYQVTTGTFEKKIF
jgi:hypothetical protein